jgi:8-oxo-dGTP diphosphatase
MKDTNINRFTSETKTRDISKLAKPALSISILIFSINNSNLELVLVNRVREPFKGFWSVPGDLIYIDESLDEAAKRVLYEKTGLKNVYLEQLYSFGDTERDPRGRVITVAFF